MESKQKLMHATIPRKCGKYYDNRHAACINKQQKQITTQWNRATMAREPSNAV